MAFGFHRGVVGERTSGDSDGTVVKTIPCNHRMKYLDDQWEDMLYAEEPDYIVVRRDTDTAGPENNGLFGRINKTRDHRIKVSLLLSLPLLPITIQPQHYSGN